VSADLVSAVDALALTTGRSPVPTGKANVGYRHEPDKLSSAGLHGRPGDTVRAERIDECPVNLEAHTVHSRPLAQEDPDDGATFVFEAAISRVHVHDSIRLEQTTLQSVFDQLALPLASEALAPPKKKLRILVSIFGAYQDTGRWRHVRVLPLAGG
jgi:flavin reductase (DIM6/NTAB) family NADH-FMN oxidoreductase RutF